MSITTQADWTGLRDVAGVVQETLDALEAAVRPGVTTAELDAVAAAVFRRRGAQSAPALTYGFPGTVLISLNDEVVHGIPGRRHVEAGDLVKIDVTARKGGYVADAARSVVAGDATTAARRLIACAEAAFRAGLSVARAGQRANDIGRMVEREVRRWGFAVVRGLTGHGVGREIHEPPTVPNHDDPACADVLTDGLVLTIEPMITAGSPRVAVDADGWTIRTRDRSLSAHYEHTLVITRGEPIVLTA